MVDDLQKKNKKAIHKKRLACERFFLLLVHLLKLSKNATPCVPSQRDGLVKVARCRVMLSRSARGIVKAKFICYII